MLPPDGLEIAAARGPFAGQEGHLDAPFATTPPEVVDAMLDLAGVGPGMRLIDLGCGDGRIAIAAARRGALALGVDIDRARIDESEAAARQSGVGGRTAFRREDMFATQLDEADIVTLYLLAYANRLLWPRLLTARAGTRIVSHAFPIGDWQPDATREIGRIRLYLWTVPQGAGARIRPPVAGAGQSPNARRTPA